MSKLKAKMIGLLSLLGIADTEGARAVTDGGQSFSGTKTLSDLARSPNSGDDLDAMPASEVMTHKGMAARVTELMQPRGVELIDDEEEGWIRVVPTSGSPSAGRYSLFGAVGYVEAVGASVTVPRRGGSGSGGGGGSGSGGGGLWPAGTTLTGDITGRLVEKPGGGVILLIRERRGV